MVSAFYYCKYGSNDPIRGSAVVDARSVDIMAWAKQWGNYALRQFSMGSVPTADVLEYIDEIASADGSLDGVPITTISGWVLLKFYLQHLGRGPNLSEKECEERALSAMLDKAMENVAQYTAVGITEEFYVSMLLYGSALRIPRVNWTAELTSKGAANEDKRFEVQEEAAKNAYFLSSEIKRYMHLDIVLYDHALAWFRNQVKEYGIGS